ncbi:MAG: hypothetical protein ACOCVM_00525 [Desulfovibrionaceae bacterium]
MADSNVVKLRLPADAAWAPLAQTVAERAASLLGLGSEKSLRLAMGSEEFVLFLAQAFAGTGVELELNRGCTHVEAAVLFEAGEADLSGLNLTFAPDLESDDGLGQMPLVLVSRMADEFTLRAEGGRMRLGMRVDFDYPVVEPDASAGLSATGETRTASPQGPAEVADACARILGRYPKHMVPVLFKTPGKVADMLAGDRLQMALARDGSGALLGAVCWEKTSGRGVGFYGPYVLAEAPDAAGLLCEHMVMDNARSRAAVLYSLKATPEVPAGLFEEAPGAAWISPEGSEVRTPFYFRHLSEDIGGEVWGHPGIEGYLEDAYARMGLVRRIRPVRRQGERLPPRSVFTVCLNHDRSEASLELLADGEDRLDNLAGHANVLRDEGFCNILLRADLSVAVQAGLAGEAVKLGFQPVLVLPFAAGADLLVLRHVRV